ncbi:amino acid adenylation domain-containing protein [Kitasatospora sp. NBC_01250]|uniref:non-ribosomal peptide synthetase n=1 Tax=Kitasatospora sp. NBC_01250 TaxID=2903571 RepID=UPI002E320543|nr:non-ribosomal peptide synthetase [Kitasatospora sp. NBC_01250]
MSTTSQSTGPDLVQRIRSLPAKRRRALVALLRQQGVDLAALDRLDGLDAPERPGPLDVLDALDTIPRLPRSAEEPVRLSFTQQRLWFLAQLDGSSAAYNIPMAVRLRGSLDRPALLRALAAVVQRHEALRTRFVERDGVPYQRIGDGGGITVAEEELADPAELTELCRQEAAAPFDLEHDPLIRIRLLRLAEQDHVLLVTMHHGVSDGWSVGVLIRDVTALYGAFHAGLPDPLAPLPVQYADFAHWQRGRLAEGLQERQVTYWKQQLAGVEPRLSLTADRERPAVKTYRGARESLQCPAELLQRLRRVAEEHDATLYMTLLAAYSIVLHRYTDQPEVAVGTVVAGRNRLELEGLIGFFANTLVMCADLSGDPAFPELLAQVKRTALAAYEHQDVPFEAVVDALQLERSLSHSPVFQTMFVLQQAQTERVARLGGLELSAIESDAGVTKFDLTLDLRETPDGLVGTVEYNTDLFDRSTITRFIGHYTELLAAIAADPTARLSRLGMIGAAERRQVLETWNDTARPFSADRCLHQLFEDAVARHPERIALVEDDRSWSYAELNAWANRIAHALRDRGIGPDGLVGLCARRSAEMVAGILGSLKAGGAYLPIDPAHPAARIAELIADSGTRVVLTQPGLDTEPLAAASLVVLHPDGRILGADGDGPSPAAGREENLPAAELGLTSEHLAYVIHTSGSTGRPKGVMIEHRAAVNRIEWMQHEYRLTEHDVVLQKTPFSFDVSVWEFFWPLLSGARLAVAEPGGHQDPGYLVEAVQRFGVTTLHFVPSMLRSMVAEPGWSRCTSVRQVFCSGEALPPDLCARHHERHSAPLHNLYGPTEAAVDVSYWPVPAGPQPRLVPIGRPIQNIRLHVLNEALEPQGIGCVGQLYIAGAGLARGYLHQPELTRERFVPDPFGEGPDARMYRTGDLARWLPDGTLEYLGRADDQVKLRGFRIELGEIEHRLAEHPAVASCAVLVREDQPGNRRLVAYTVLTDQGAAEPAASDSAAAGLRAELVRHLERALPEYMVPSAFVTLPELPVTAHGKLDRKALPAPGIDAFAQRAYTAPSTPTERLLAGLWAELLGFDEARIGAEDNFFALGGHSLLITVLLARLGELGRRTTVRAVFGAGTLAELAARIDQDEAVAQYTAPPNLIPPGCEELTPELLPLIDLSRQQLDAIVAAVPGGAPNIQDVYPLVSTQEGILFHHLMDPDQDPYLVSTLYVAEDEAACTAFTRALQAVIDRHDVMRTAVLTSGLPAPVQVVHRTAELPVQRVLLEPGEDAEQQARALLNAFGRMPLERAPLLRLLVAEDPGSPRRYLLLNAHHLIEDATSLRLTLEELGLHLAGRTGLLAPPAPYRDFVAHTLRHQEPEAVTEYFRGVLGDLTEPTTPFGLTDVRGNGSRVRQLRRTLPAPLTEELRAQGRRLRLSPACLFHAAWACVVAAAAGRDDVVFGAVLSGRLQGVPGVERMLGNFINTLPLRARLAGRTVHELIAEVDAGLRDLIVHEQSPLSLAQRCSGMAGDAPLFSAVVNFRHFEPGGGAEPAPTINDAGVRFLAAGDAINYPVTVSLDDFGSELSLEVQVDGAVLPEALADHVERALAGIVAALAEGDGDRTAALDIDVLPAAERHRLLTEWRGAAHRAAEPTLTAAFEAQVARTPERTALVFEDQELSYAEFNARANRLAHWLIEQGAGPEQLVAIRLPRSVELVTAVYAVLKTGAAYLPIEPDLPQERVDGIFADCKPLLVLDQELPDTAGRPGTDPGVAVTGEHTAYVLYTSGSTGRPKGVMVPHRSGTNWLAWNQRRYRLGEQGRLLLKTSVGFDISVPELFWPLQVGGALVIARPDGHRDPAYLARLIREQRVTDVYFAPSMLAAFLAEPDAAHCTELRRVEAVGEALPVELAERLARALPAVELFNGYGPTEAGAVTAWQYRAEPEATGVPIGSVVDNTRVYVLDPALRLAPTGAAGELYIAGEGLARGYLDRPELTAERFVADPFTPGARMYRTGDLVRWRSDGVLDYLGRADDQVKVRGFRVEPDEIASALLGHPAVGAAVVVPRGSAEAVSLVGYLSPAPQWLAEQDGEDGEDGKHSEDGEGSAGGEGAAGGPELARRLKEYLAGRLPHYMVPGVLVVLDELPVTPNGKIDKRALPAPAESDLAQQVYLAPRTVAERTLCRIIAELLGLSRVGVRDSFLDLGGHSLLATRLTLRARQETGAELPLQLVLTGATVERMARALEQAAPAERESVPLLPAAGQADEEAPLALQQSDLWFLNRPAHLGAAHDNVQMAFRIEGRLDREAYARAVRALVERHAVLRTGYLVRASGVTQRVHPVDGFTVDVLPVEPAAVQPWLRAERARPFAPQGHHQLRAHLLALGEEEHIAVLSRPWGVFDGWSVNLVLSELLSLYQAFSQGEEPGLAPLPLQYTDFARWQRGVLDAAELDRQQDYWRRQLAGLPGCLALRTDYPRPEVKSYQGASVAFGVPLDLLGGLRQLAKEHGATLYQLLLSAFAVLLGAHTEPGRGSELAIGTAVTNRPRAELDQLVGYFVNTLVLRLDPAGHRTFTELLAQVRQVTAEAHEHKDLPFADLVRELAPAPDPAHPPLCQVVFNLLPGTAAATGGAGGPGALAVHPLAFDSGTTRYDLNLVAQEGEEGLHGYLEYSTDLFAPGTAERLARAYERLLREVVATPDSEVALLSQQAG